MAASAQEVMGTAVPVVGHGLLRGFRFHPTDEELVSYYLRPKATLHDHHRCFIPVVNLYNYEPWELPCKCFWPSRGDTRAKGEWYLYVSRDRKYPNGNRVNRATPAGFWKSTGKDRAVLHNQAVIGMKKALVYHRGRSPNGILTDWVMHEYCLHGDMTPMQDTYAICRLYKKNMTIPSPKVPSGAVTDTEGAPIISVPKVAAVDTEGASWQFLPSIANIEMEGASIQFVATSAAADEEQLNIDDFFAD